MKLYYEYQDIFFCDQKNMIGTMTFNHFLHPQRIHTQL